MLYVVSLSYFIDPLVIVELLSDDNLVIKIIPLKFQELSAEVLKERKALIRKLQTQLRNEEMSLVLLKKIRQSQVMAEQAKAEAAKVSIQPAGTANSGHHRQSQSNHGTPPPSQASASKRGSSANAQNMSNARSSAGINATGQNMKQLLTPDLSILKPVSSVSQTYLTTTFFFYLIKDFCDDFCKNNFSKQFRVE